MPCTRQCRCGHSIWWVGSAIAKDRCRCNSNPIVIPCLCIQQFDEAFFPRRICQFCAVPIPIQCVNGLSKLGKHRAQHSAAWPHFDAAIFAACQFEATHNLMLLLIRKITTDKSASTTGLSTAPACRNCRTLVRFNTLFNFPIQIDQMDFAFGKIVIFSKNALTIRGSQQK